MNETALPAQAASREEIICPSCGRFVGALTRCPHCGAAVRKRLSVRVFRYFALLLGTVGLLFLYLMVRNREIPLVKIGEITPTMNFAYVRVHGRVASDARVYREGDQIQGLGFVVDDGSGEIGVRAYRAVARELLASNMVPRMGDTVTVAGSLSVSADDHVLLRLQSPQQLKLEPADVPRIKLADLSEKYLGKSVIVQGVVSHIIAPRPGSRAPWVIRISDDTGSGDLTFWDDVYAELPQRERLVLGAVIQARAGVSQHRGALQLRVSRGQDITFLQGEEARRASEGVEYTAQAGIQVTPSEIKPTLIGRVVLCEGEITSLQPPPEGSRAPWRMRLSDGKGGITVVFWQDVASHIRNLEQLVGRRVRVEGRVDQYRGRLQIKLAHSRALTVLEGAAPASQAEVQPISSVTSNSVGEVVTVSGILQQPRGIPGGVIYPLKDAAGTIPVVLWDRAIPGSSRDWMEPGVRVRVTGTVKDYHGTLEIVPRSIRDIVKTD